jgi:hypothetical protein
LRGKVAPSERKASIDRADLHRHTSAKHRLDNEASGAESAGAMDKAAQRVSFDKRRGLPAS